MKTTLASLLPLLLVALGACSASPSSSGAEDVGEISAAISSVPSNVACIDIQVANGERVVDRPFTVTPGQGGANLALTGLPLGSDVLSGLAYAVPCASVTAATSADWATDPVAATLAPGKTGNVSLQFHAAGSLTVGVGFDDAGVEPWVVASPNSVAFNYGPCNAVVTPQTVTITNQGSASTKALSVVFGTATGRGVFAVASGSDKCTGKTLAVGASCTVAVTITNECDYVTATMTVGDGVSSAAVSLAANGG